MRCFSFLLPFLISAALAEGTRFHNIRQIPLTTFEKNAARPAAVAAPIVEAAGEEKGE